MYLLDIPCYVSKHFSILLLPTQKLDVATDCIDVQGYKDKHGTTCKQTEEYGNCSGGKPVKVDANLLKKDSNADGVSVLDACCACGGGLRGGLNIMY